MFKRSKKPANGTDEEAPLELDQSDKNRTDEEHRLKDYQKSLSILIKGLGIKQRTGDSKEDANSFGEIEFDGFDRFENKRAPFIRVADDTPVRILLKLMVDGWKIPKPKMIISLAGGVKHFVGWNEDRLKKLLNQGFVKAAINTDAWIILEGSAPGVMQKLGRAIMEESRLTEGKEKKVVALGIADWNTTKNKEALTNLSSNEGSWPVKYRKCALKEPAGDGNRPKQALNCNYTHFILVDNAKESTSAHIKLRANLERHIRNQGGHKFDAKKPKKAIIADAKTTDKENTIIPVVLVVVEGGYGTIETVQLTLRQNVMNAEDRMVGGIPVVIVGGSGRAAGIIVRALCMMDDDEFKDNDSVEDLKNDIKRILGGNIKQVDDCVSMLKEISDHRHRKRITVFQMDDANLKDIDGTMLRAVLPDLPVKQQLDLAVALNRCDIARDEILTPDKLVSWQQNITHLKETFRNALIHNKADFVELLLTYLVDTNEFATKQWLEHLYNELLYGSVREVNIKFSTRHILKEMLGSYYSAFKLRHVYYLLLKITNNDYEETDYSKNIDELNKSGLDKHIFLLAVLLNRRALAVLFFKRLTTGNIGAALIASRILRALSVYAMEKQQQILHDDLVEHAQEYEKYAIGILENIHEADKKLSYLALVRTLPAWGKTTCMSIAYSTKNMEFIKHDTCQRILDKVWKGKLVIYSKKHWLTFFLGTILPLFPFMLSLADVTRPATESKRDGNEDNSCQRIIDYFRWKGKEAEQEVKRSGRHVTFWEKMRYFYTAPITKFAYCTASYIVLLFLFAFFIMTDLRPSEELNSPGTIERIVVIWVGTLIVEEARQMIPDVKKWFSEVWNRFDLVMYMMFSLSLSLRFLLPPNEFGAARVMYSLTFIAFCLRLLHMGFVFKEVGPRIILITKIMKDLFFFVFMLALFVVSFGIAQEALMNPNIRPSSHLMLRPLYKPYWQLFGELGFEVDEGFVENTTCSGDTSSMKTCFEIDKYRWMAPVLTAIYMLISSILLINIFIAIFSVTLERAEDNAEAIWMYHRFGLLLEYLDRPTLAPPLIIINHMHRLVVKLKKCVCKEDKKYTSFEESTSLRIQLESAEDEELNLSEHKHLQNYFNKKIQQDIDTSEKRLEKVQERILTVEEKVNRMEKHVEKKIDNMEEKVEKELDNMQKNVAEILKILKT